MGTSPLEVVRTLVAAARRSCSGDGKRVLEELQKFLIYS